MSKKIENMVILYADAGDRLLELLQQMEEGSWSWRRAAELLRQVDEIINELTQRAGDQMADILGDSYMLGVRGAVEGIVAAGVAAGTLNASIRPIIHQQAVQSIMDESFYSILEASDNMSADAKQRITDAVRRANERSLVDGISRRKATKDAVRSLSERQITGIITKSGAKVPADKYMAGVVQYHQRKAHVTGAENMIVQNGLDLVYVNYVGITCGYCATMQGRVYSISGNDPRFPKLEQRPPYHAHCVHSVSAWIEEYTEPEEVSRMLELSNRPFNDNRTAHAKQRYEQLQRDKSRKNATRNQWIRYKALLPDDTPSLRQFASHKARGTAKYKELQDLYRDANRQIKDTH
ncbi:phage minor capsid protein [Paenibacillus daejeonensis]|uniref:phage minor capsid protein n=1 Tax=Paenibacillus daejeonensis TaxID=135193 RepID=UPI000377391C|nr:phage minor capsid protein [Paenibacillus daejeonensis]